jgi:hypothetical protein
MEIIVNKGEIMSKATFFAFNDKATFRTLDLVFARYGMKMKEVKNADERGLNYVDEIMDHKMFKYIGYACKSKCRCGDFYDRIAEPDTRTFQKIRALLVHPSYSKKFSKFNAKLSKLNEKLEAAKKVAKSAGASAEATEKLKNSCQFVSDIINTVDSYVGSLSSDPSVMAVQKKIDRFIAKNKALHDSQLYTAKADAMQSDLVKTTAVATNVNGSAAYGKDNSIDNEIARIKAASKAEVDATFSEFKGLINALLTGAQFVGFMVVANGKYDGVATSERNVVIGKMEIEDFIYIKPYEKLNFYLS